jgi:hypothetical protein
MGHSRQAKVVVMASVRQNPTGNAVEDRRALETLSDIRAMLRAPFLKGRFITFTTAGAGSITVPHGLGSKPQGWIVTDIDGLIATLSRDSWDERRITFFSSAAATFTVWVF